MRLFSVRWLLLPPAIVVVAGAACSPRRVRPAADCTATAALSAGDAPSPARAEKLAGAYRILAMTTTHGYGGAVIEAHLTLGPADTLRRYYVRRGLRGWVRGGGERPLVGSFAWRGPSGDLGPDQEASLWRTGAAVGLFVGCDDCTDASPLNFSVERLDARGFSGRWSYASTGIAVAVDSAGRRLPPPEGYYCAFRERP